MTDRTPTLESREVYNEVHNPKFFKLICLVVGLVTLAAGFVVGNQGCGTIPSILINFPLLLAALFLLLIAFGFKISVDSEALRVRLVLLPLSLHRIPLNTITAVRIEDRPQFCYGYRMGIRAVGLIFGTPKVIQIETTGSWRYVFSSNNVEQMRSVLLKGAEEAKATASGQP